MSLRVRGIRPRTALRDLTEPLALHEGGTPTASVRAVLAPEGERVRVSVRSRAQGAWLAVGRRGAPESVWDELPSLSSAQLSQSVFARTADGPVRVLRDPATGRCARRPEDPVAFVWLSAAPDLAPPPWPDAATYGLTWPRGDRAEVLVAGRALLFVPDSFGQDDVVTELFAAEAADVHPTSPLRPLAPAGPALPRPDLTHGRRSTRSARRCRATGARPPSSNSPRRACVLARGNRSTRRGGCPRGARRGALPRRSISPCGSVSSVTMSATWPRS